MKDLNSLKSYLLYIGIFFSLKRAFQWRKIQWMCVYVCAFCWFFERPDKIEKSKHFIERMTCFDSKLDCRNFLVKHGAEDMGVVPSQTSRKKENIEFIFHFGFWSVQPACWHNLNFPKNQQKLWFSWNNEVMFKNSKKPQYFGHKHNFSYQLMSFNLEKIFN